MRQAFSRWPSLAATSAPGAEPKLDALPAWMSAPMPRQWPTLVADIAVAAVLVIVPTALALLAGWLARNADGLALAAAALTVVAAGLAVAIIARLRRMLRGSEGRFEAIFERAGISMWREDWMAVGEAVLNLRRAGITDIESYFADRQDELRALKAKVMIRDVNAFTLEETGAACKEVYLGSLARLLPDTDQTFVQWLVAFGRGDRFFRSEAHVTTADGTEIDTLFTAMLPQDLAGFADIVVTSVDITAFKKAQARLAEAEADAARTSRVTTASALSASIAHEVNSPLAAILANAQAAHRLLRRDDPDVTEALAAVEDVVQDATRARDVVARTTSFFSKAPLSFGPVDVLQAARGANLMVEAEVRALGAVVHISAPEDLPAARGDLVQIQQVFANLLLNAAQAMADSSKARDITVAIRAERNLVGVTVADMGPGIEPDRRAQIFEPFHSTRPGGMGMGLAICRNCIDAHGGDIRVDAGPVGGAAFHFTLPVAHV